MIKISFFYSPIYDDMFHRAVGRGFSVARQKSGEKLLDQLISEWNKVESKVLRAFKKFKLQPPVDQTVYVIQPQKGIASFSKPLTVVATARPDRSVESLVHELVHVALDLPANKKIGDDIWDHLTKYFFKESLDDRIHLPVMIFERAILIEVFGEQKATALTKWEKTLPGLAHPWKIIDAHKTLPKDPFQAVLALRSIK